MGDEIPFSNVVLIERDAPNEGWYVQIGAADYRYLSAWAQTPTKAILNLCAKIRDEGWWFDPGYEYEPALQHSPNVIVLRCLGPVGWQSWYAASWGHEGGPVTFSDADPAIALAGFALRMKQRRYMLDADFRFTDRTADAR